MKALEGNLPLSEQALQEVTNLKTEPIQVPTRVIVGAPKIISEHLIVIIGEYLFRFSSTILFETY